MTSNTDIVNPKRRDLRPHGTHAAEPGQPAPARDEQHNRTATAAPPIAVAVLPDNGLRVGWDHHGRYSATRLAGPSPWLLDEPPAAPSTPPDVDRSGPAWWWEDRRTDGQRPQQPRIDDRAHATQRR